VLGKVAAWTKFPPNFLMHCHSQFVIGALNSTMEPQVLKLFAALFSIGAAAGFFAGYCVRSLVSKHRREKAERLRLLMWRERL
jgi:fructose-specific phosphotransferase system IIC component